MIFVHIFVYICNCQKLIILIYIRKLEYEGGHPRPTTSLPTRNGSKVFFNSENILKSNMMYFHFFIKLPPPHCAVLETGLNLSCFSFFSIWFWATSFLELILWQNLKVRAAQHLYILDIVFYPPSFGISSCIRPE